MEDIFKLNNKFGNHNVYIALLALALVSFISSTCIRGDCTEYVTGVHISNFFIKLSILDVCLFLKTSPICFILLNVSSF